MKKSSELYAIKIQCKRYVQRYLILHFGRALKDHPYLVDIRKDKQLRDFLDRASRQPFTREDKKYDKLECKKRNCEVELLISADMFNRNGWSLSVTDEVRLNSILESRCKQELLRFLTLQYLMHEDIQGAIDEFYHKYGYSQLSWPSASIAKIWTRYKAKSTILALKEEIDQIFTTFFMEKLSTKRTISPDSLEPCIN